MKRTFIGLASLTLAAAMVVACSDDGPSTMTETGETAGDGDPGDGDPGDGDGDPGDGDGDPEPAPDADMDGVPDDTDNCPDNANPNQLDFDGNGLGNACDTQVFNTVSGNLMSTAVATSAVGGCNVPIMIEVTGGTIMIQLDDDAAVAAFEINHLEIADIVDQQCDFGVAQVGIDMTNFTIDNDGDPFPVSVAHDQMQHDSGQVLGNSDVPHPVRSVATLTTDLNGDVMMSDLDLPGELPTFTANVSGGGSMGTLSWADGAFVLAMDTFMVTVLNMNVNIDFELRGLSGALSIAP